MKRVHLFLMIGLAAAMAAAQQNSANQDMNDMPMPGHDMSSTSDHDISRMQTQDAAAENASGAHAMHSMEGHHMEMGPHMKMTALRSPQPGDEERAQRVVEAARKVAERYRDYHAALNDGYRIFLPNVPQEQYHFTNYRYAIEALFRFNPEQPTSLLYKKSGDAYQLIGVMYTAPKRFTEDDLNQRIPLSIAQWHEHVNFCAPPAGRKREMLGANAKFGLRGSIFTQAECEANGGTFHPVIFNWMVHVYPFEKDSAQIWSVERQVHGNGGD